MNADSDKEHNNSREIATRQLKIKWLSERKEKVLETMVYIMVFQNLFQHPLYSALHFHHQNRSLNGHLNKPTAPLSFSSFLDSRV